ncbi:hypothetical protein MIMGU_mgv1a019661mg [Erythranthe guttata]|uniref:WRKY domain-containing protein n=1 Tax=Erythranthe guttata TaxID=4155 RepID=A0A022R0J4_ERYGU|nr:hypothetical protein MIMGU_mgv1a019661mg [Erythranthe guttata]
MGVFDDHVAIMGDWMPPSPSPRSLFSSTNNNVAFERSIADPSGEIKTGPVYGNADHNFPVNSNALTEQKTSFRGGLMERMAARAGFNAPRLNTESSPCLTIPPGLSPTSLLDSPVFLSNSLAQPSPTTGKFAFAPPSGNYWGPTLLNGEVSSKANKTNNFEDNQSFAFKPIQESGSFPCFNYMDKTYQSVGGGAANLSPEQTYQSVGGGGTNNSPPLDEPLPHQEDGDQRIGGGDAVAGGTLADDGYNWRKYGQKQVKGSEYPRSYYKCTHANCPVKKKVERSHEGHITEIIYKGAHKHPKPPPNRRSSLGPPSNGADGGVDRSLTLSNEEEEDDRVTHGSVSLGCDGEGEELESKRRRIENYASEVSGASRAIREPRVVVQTTSEVDILDDGYRWRKYGQKVVKGNPNPRSYYKCTSTGCNVRKHVERASHDLKSVITTYEGKHNHDVPMARNSSHVNSGGAPTHPLPNTHQQPQSGSSVSNHMQRPDMNMTRFERPPSMGSFNFPHVGPGPGFGFGSGFVNHQYLGHQLRPMNSMGFMLPKMEPEWNLLLASTRLMDRRLISSL